jgi:general secretion pathway protein L
MKTYTLIQLDTQSPNNSQWVSINDSGEFLDSVSKGNISEIDIGNKQNSVIVILPGEEIHHAVLTLPIKSEKKLTKAIPFAMEDRLADEIEKTHFAHKRLNNDLIQICAINTSKLKAFLETLKSNNIHASAITSDALCVPKIEKTITLLIDSSRIHINNGFDKVFTFESIDIINAVNIVNKDNNIRDIQIFINKEDESLLNKFDQLRESFRNVDVNILQNGPFQKYSQVIVNHNYIDLLQGKYKDKKDIAQIFKPWRKTASLFLLFVSLLLINNLLNIYSLNKYERELSAKFLNQYKYFNPRADNVSDPLRIISSIKNNNIEITDESSFIEGLSFISDAIKNNNNASLSSINFQNNNFNIRLQTPNVSILDSIQRNIDRNRDYQAKILTTNQIDDAIESRIEIQVSR